MLYEMTRWWTYRKIKHPLMVYYVWVWPAVISLVSTALFAFLPAPPAIVGIFGLLASLMPVVGLLPGFFIAALAASATFTNDYIDRPMPSPAPTVRIVVGEDHDDIELTRRTFLTYLFSYLAVISFLITMGIAVVNLFYPSLSLIIDGELFSEFRGVIRTCLKYSYLLLLFYFLGSVLISSLHGIYFLAERLHRP